MGSSGIDRVVAKHSDMVPAPMEQPGLVSVIVPTYNRALLLERAIQSVRCQTYERLEIIVVDDASKDDTAALVRSIDDARVRYIRHDRNRGGAAARNTGIRAARGEFIAFLDDDDQWEPEKTAAQLKLLKNYNVVLCRGDRTVPIDRSVVETVLQLHDLRRGEITAGGTGVLMAKAHVLRTTMFDENLPRYQDWDIFIRLALKHRIVYLNRPLIRYNEGSHARITNSVVCMDARELERQFVMLRKHRKFFGESLFRRHMCRALLYGLRHREDCWAHLLYVLRHYGALNTISALWSRIQAVIRKRMTIGTADIVPAQRPM